MTAGLCSMAKTQLYATFIVGHMTKERNLNWSSELDMVDTVLFGERQHMF